LKGREGGKRLTKKKGGGTCVFHLKKKEERPPVILCDCLLKGKGGQATLGKEKKRKGTDVSLSLGELRGRYE